jgi:hypothetical protein
VAILTLSQVIARPVGDVFDTVVDGATFAEWNPTVKRANRLTEGPIGNGPREFERNRRVRIVPQLRSVRGGHRFTSVPERTRIDHELEMAPQGVPAPRPGDGGRNLRATAAAGAASGHLLTQGGAQRTARPPSLRKSRSASVGAIAAARS